LLGDEAEFADPFLVLWRLADGYAVSADVPGVKIPPRPFLGTAALARGRAVRDYRGDVGMAYAEVGTRLLLPVWTSEAMVSLGDSHFAQGQGQVGPGIEMAATWRLSVELRKHDATIRGQRHPHFERPRHQHNHSSDPSGVGSDRVFATTSVRDGLDHDEPTRLATREALLEMIDYLRDEHRYSAQQAYALCGVAVHLRLTVLRHHTHTPVTVTALLPLSIFD
jgi:formamidase